MVGGGVVGVGGGATCACASCAGGGCGAGGDASTGRGPIDAARGRGPARPRPHAARSTRVGAPVPWVAWRVAGSVDTDTDTEVGDPAGMGADVAHAASPLAGSARLTEHRIMAERALCCGALPVPD